MGLRTRARAASLGVLLAWVFNAVALSEVLVDQLPNEVNLRTKGGLVVFFAAVGFVLLTLCLLTVGWYALRELEGLRWRPVWALSGLASLCALISFSVAVRDGAPANYGYGFGFETAVWLVAMFSAVMAFNADRAAGNV